MPYLNGSVDCHFLVLDTTKWGTVRMTMILTCHPYASMFDTLGCLAATVAVASCVGPVYQSQVKSGRRIQLPQAPVLALQVPWLSAPASAAQRAAPCGQPERSNLPHAGRHLAGAGQGPGPGQGERHALVSGQRGQRLVSGRGFKSPTVQQSNHSTCSAFYNHWVTSNQLLNFSCKQWLAR